MECCKTCPYICEPGSECATWLDEAMMGGLEIERAIEELLVKLEMKHNKEEDMTKNQVNTPLEALAYSLDCQLATVVELNFKKSKGKYDFQRQIGIAQNLMDFCISFGADISKTRGVKVARFGNSVETWVAAGCIDG